MSNGFLSKGGIPADQIPVSLFREILIWPLALHLPDDYSESDGLVGAVTCAVDRITQNRRLQWEPVDDPIRHIPEPPNFVGRLQWKADVYAEGLYFHEFVQRFLFSTQQPRPAVAPPSALHDRDEAPFRLFQRGDLRELVVELPGHAAIPFEVERVNLYIFRTGAAVLVVEIAIQAGFRSGLNLADVLTCHDLLRRVYPPFTQIQRSDGGSELAPQFVAKSMTWRRAAGKGEDKHFAIGPKTAADMVDGYTNPPLPDDPAIRGRRFAPILEHWSWLLEDTLPIAPRDHLKDSRWDPGEGRWHQVIDERMPTIATVSVCGKDENPRYFYDRTRSGDLIRLCFADQFDSSTFPYDPEFLANFNTEHVYGRFRDRGTLFLASGYAFVAYGVAGAFFENNIATHMRRHYFQMGLLAHFELASLLSFSSRISRAVEHHDDADPTIFEDRMQAIEDEFLQFVHRFRFTGVSNHTQAHDLFELWRRHLRLDTVFEDLYTEITSATRYLGNRANSRSARMAERLSIIATFGVIFGLAFSFLGMNVLFDASKLIWSPGNRVLPLGILVWITTFFMGVFLVVFWILSTIGERRPRRSRITRSSFERRLQFVLIGVFILISLISVGLAVAYLYR